MAQAAELIRVGTATTGRKREAGLTFQRSVRVILTEWRERSRQQSQLAGYVGLQDLGRQTGVQG